MSESGFENMSSLYTKHELVCSKICLGVVSTFFAIAIGSAFGDEWIDEDTVLPVYLVLVLAALCYGIEAYRYYSKASLINEHIQGKVKYSKLMIFEEAMKRKQRISLRLFFVEFLLCFIMFVALIFVSIISF